MDGYQAATNWLVFGAVVGAAAFYYWPRDQRRPDRRRENESQAMVRKRRNEQQSRRPMSECGSDRDVLAVVGTDSRSYAEVAKKPKPQTKQAARPQEAPASGSQSVEPEETDMNTRQWAAQMQKTRQGMRLGSQQRAEKRVKTVKQSSAVNTPVLSSGSSLGEADADDDMSPAGSPSLGAGDVSDMLEPVTAGPTVLRVTAPSNLQKERVSRPTKEQQAEETKKQRQNRKKVEERRIQHEEEERARKALEERQRRAAREARGEPAKNGLGVSRPPAQNAWVAASPTSRTDESAPRIVNGSATDNPLLDTFDAESTASSADRPEPSTAATSTADGDAVHVSHDLPSEEEQLAHAVKQSGDEFGWQTVAVPKKSKKKAEAPATTVTSSTSLTNRTNLDGVRKQALNGKPKGFLALDVQYEQRADADPNDATNWDA